MLRNKSNRKEVKTMLKKVTIASIFFVSVLTLSNPAWTQTLLNDLDFTIAGSLRATINLPGFIDLTVSTPKLENFSEYFVFCDPNTCGGEAVFFDGVLFTAGGSSLLSGGLVYPIWTQTGNNFVIDLTDIADSIGGMLSALGLTGTLSDKSFIGKVAGNSITARLNISFTNMSVDLRSLLPDLPVISNGSICITGSFRGSNPQQNPFPWPPAPAAALLSLNEGNKPFLMDMIANLVKQMVSLVVSTGGAQQK